MAKIKPFAMRSTALAINGRTLESQSPAGPSRVCHPPTDATHEENPYTMSEASPSDAAMTKVAFGAKSNRKISRVAQAVQISRSTWEARVAQDEPMKE